MKKFVGLLVVALLLAMGSVACAGIDFTLEFSRDFDAEETSGFAELVVSAPVDPLDLSLTWTHDFLPEETDTFLGNLGFTLGPVGFGYEKELTADDPGIGTIELIVEPITIGYEYEFADDKSGKVTATLAKSF